MEQHSKKNKTVTSLTIIFIALLIILFLSWLYIFNIYEVNVTLKEESSLQYVVDVIPLNSLGMRAPFRNLEYSFEVTEGEVEIEKLNDLGNGRIDLKLKTDSSKVKLEITTNKSQNISLIEIPKHKME